MMIIKTYIRLIPFLLALLLTSCQNEEPNTTTDPSNTPVKFNIVHPAQAGRATDSGFETGDRVGVYMCEAGSHLDIGGGLLNNEPLSYNGNSWNMKFVKYWSEGFYDAYAYHPYTESVTSVIDMPFSVNTDQSADKGYKASDFLHARTLNVSASEKAVPLVFNHIMSKLTVRLVKSEDFEGEMPTKAEVYIHNTTIDAVIDLSEGIATRNPKGSRETIRARQTDDYSYSAILVPQRIDTRVPLIEVVMSGVSYLYESTFVFKRGVNHIVNLIVPNNPELVKIEMEGEVQNWQ